MAKSNNESTTKTNTSEFAITEQTGIEKSTGLQRSSLEIFDTSKKILSNADMVAITNSGIFEEEGTDLSAKIANSEYWEENKGVELSIIMQDIIPFESNSDEMDDTDAAVCVVVSKGSNGEVKTEKILILNSFPVSEFKKYGTGAYKITYLGKKKSTKNAMYSYADFSIKLQGSFVK